MKRFIIILSVLFSCNLLFSQTLQEKAETAYANKDYINAIDLYNKLLTKAKDKSQKGTCAYYIAESYKAAANYTDAAKWFEEAISNGYPNNEIYNDYGLMLLMLGNNQKAKEQFDIVLKANPSDSIANIYSNSCTFAEASLKEKVMFEVTNEKKINSKYSDYGVEIINDTTLLFASSRVENPLTDKIYDFNSQAFSDFYVSKLDRFQKVWKAPAKCNGGINSPFNDGTVAFDAKTNTAYFMQCNGLDGSDYRCNIYSSVYNANANTWSQATPFEYSNKDFSTGHPVLNNTGDIMYFVSDMPGGEGGKDIWMIKKQNGQWGSPINMGKKINTKGNEMFPTLLNDSLLYFSSNGWKGFGGLDIFKINLTDKLAKEPTNCKYPFNSGADDFSINFKDENIGYFTSNRPGGLGDDDIYSFKNIPIILIAKGFVKEKVTGTFISDAKVYLKGMDGRYDSTYSNGEGKFIFRDINVNTEYLVTVKKDGYFGDSKRFNTNGINKSALIAKASGYDIDLVLDLTFDLQKITKEEIELKDIFYDYAKTDLRESSKTELLKLVKIMNDNPDLIFMINAHTDSRGKDKANLKLSDGRAKSVVDFLISQGISANRLKSKGWGETSLKIKNAKTEEEHQVNRRTTFSIINAQ